jgi:hypothetical protein
LGVFNLIQTAIVNGRTLLATLSKQRLRSQMYGKLAMFH